MTIWKYPLEVRDMQYVEMPKGARLLDVQMQGNVPCLWALVNPEVEKERRAIYIRGTGHDATEIIGLSYVATFQIANGSLVFHVFVAA